MTTRLNKSGADSRDDARSNNSALPDGIRGRASRPIRKKVVAGGASRKTNSQKEGQQANIAHECTLVRKITPHSQPCPKNSRSSKVSFPEKRKNQTSGSYSSNPFSINAKIVELGSVNNWSGLLKLFDKEKENFDYVNFSTAMDSFLG